MSNILYDTGSVSDKVGKTVESAVSLQQQIQALDPNKKEDQKKLNELQAQTNIMKMFLDKLKELEGDMRGIMQASMRKGQSQ